MIYRPACNAWIRSGQRAARLSAQAFLSDLTAEPAARNRKDRLDRALRDLAQAGITGDRAYAPFWRWLARRGLIVRPFHYWNFVALCLAGFVMFPGVTALLFWMAFTLDVMPRPLQGMLRAGPNAVLGGIVAMGIIWALVHRVQAHVHKLPRWRDL
jgi:Family of unknown function (DUF6404)